MLDDLDDNVLKDVRKVFSRLKKNGYDPKIIFDVGASYTGWSCYVKKVFPEAEYYLFEPLVNYYSAYQDFIKKSLDMFPSFKLYQIALGEKSGELTMNLFLDNVSASTALDMTNTGIQTTPVKVKMLAIDDAVESLKLPLPQVIKIDTQGYELSILKGAQNTLPHVDILLLECWLYLGYGKHTPLLTEIIEWLMPFHFRLWDMVEPYRNEDGSLAAIDCFFVNTQSRITPDWYYA
jgi:FkbM family methyltransferase